MRRVVATIGLWSAALLTAPDAVRAQTNLETNAGVQFNFLTPGAGNLGMGSAFIALAFDATAAYTNPAGLAQVVRPEAWVEARSWRYTHLYTDRGRLVGPHTGVGADDTTGLRDGESRDQVAGPSFASVVYPRGRWTFAVHRHQLVDFEARFDTQGAFLEQIRGRSLPGIPGEREGRLAALRNAMELNIVGYGGAVAGRVHPRLLLGLSVSRFEFELDSLARRFVPMDPFEGATFAESELVNFQSQVGDDSEWSYSAGVLWQSPRRRWSAGGVFRGGPSFDLEVASVSAVPSDDPRAFDPVRQAAEFHVPDIFGLGLAYRPSDALTVALDYVQVQYSDLTDGFVDIFGLEALGLGEAQIDRFEIDDAGEVHLGTELSFYRRRLPFSVRAGVWYDPDHRLRYEGDNLAFHAVFRRGSDELHYAIGAGIVARRLQIDAAFDYSERVSVTSLSAGVRF